MARYAIVESGTVIAMMEWDGTSEHPDSSKAILADDNAYVGGTYDGSSFSITSQPEDDRTYAEKREVAYPKIGDQLDMLWHAIDADTTLKSKYADFHAAIKTVKDDNPKS